jgi:hypothetical protein
MLQYRDTGLAWPTRLLTLIGRVKDLLQLSYCPSSAIAVASSSRAYGEREELWTKITQGITATSSAPGASVTNHLYRTNQ